MKFPIVKEEELIMESETSVEVKVDVTKIVKYVCIAGAVIVAVIFGSKCVDEYLKGMQSE